MTVLLVCGCADGDAFAYEDIEDALAGSGASVEVVDVGAWGPFSVEGIHLIVDGHDVRIMEYPDVAASRQEAATIGMEGWSVNNTPVEWIGWPHFWTEGRVIVLYLGEDPAAIEMITDVLGPELDLSGPEDPARFCEISAELEALGDPFSLPPEQARPVAEGLFALMTEAHEVVPEEIQFQIDDVALAYLDLYPAYEAAGFDSSKLDRAAVEHLFISEEDRIAGLGVDEIPVEQWLDANCGAGG